MKADFFVVLGSGEGMAVLRIELTDVLQRELSGHFEKHAEYYSASSTKAHRFDDATYRPDENEALFIPSFDLPEQWRDMLADSIGQHHLSEGMLNNGVVRAIVARFGSGQSAWLAIHVLDKRQVMSTKGFSLVLGSNTFRRLESPALHIGDDVHGVFRDGKLFFYSITWMRRLFNMEPYIRQATDKEVAAFTKDPHIHIADPDLFVDQCDEWVRKRLARIIDSKVLKDIEPKKLRRLAKGYPVVLEFVKDGTKEKLIIPPDKQEMKNLLKFLEEDYYPGLLTGEKYVASSKRKAS